MDGAPVDNTAVIAALTGIGQALAAASIFGPDHFRARQASEAAGKAVIPLLARRPQVALGAGSGHLVLDGARVEGRDHPQIRTLETRLAALHSHGFILQRGLTPDDLHRLIARIATHREAGFDETLKTAPIPHVLGGQWVWQALGKDAKAAPPVPGPARADPRPPRPGGVLQLDDTAVDTTLPEGTPTSENDPQARLVLAYLLDAETATPGPGVGEALRALSRDADRLAALLVRAAGGRDAGGRESLRDAVEAKLVALLRRTVGTLRGAPGEAPPADFRRALLLLENGLQRRLRSAGGGTGWPPRVAAAFAELVAAAELDALAADYRELRRRTADTEQRLLQQALARGPAPVEAALLRAGVTADEWRALAARFAESTAGH